jgi:CHAD domain-containing protein
MGRVTTPPAGLQVDQPFAQAGRRVIDLRAQEMFRYADGVLDIDQPDRLHDMRVASRRLRAALEIFATCFPQDEHETALSEVKVLADALGRRRDCDVQLASLTRLRTEVTLSEQRAINLLVKQLRREQRRANRRLARALQRVERNDLTGRLARLSA